MTLIGLGHLFSVAEETRTKLEELGYSVALINPRWIKPLDGGTIESFARKAKIVCTFEDHVLKNGFGCAVIELLHDARITTPVERIGWPRFFELTGLPFTKHHVDNWRGARNSLNASTHIRF